MPRVVAATREAGHPAGPYASLLDRDDPTKGIDTTVAQPRYATGYFPLRNRPSILVENHAYKPYESRVRANHDFLLALFGEIAREPRALTEAVREAERRTVALGAPDAPASRIVVRYATDDVGDTVEWPVYAWSSSTYAVDCARPRCPGSTAPHRHSSSRAHAAISWHRVGP
jgi:hypothetical protein